MGEELHKLNTDIADIEVRPDNDIGLAGNFAFSLDLLCGNARIYSGIELELTVDGEVGTTLLGDLYRRADLVDHRAFGRAVGGVREHGNTGLPAHERLHRLGVFDGITAVYSPEPVDASAIITEGVEEQNKVSNVGTISYLPATFGIFCASVVINDLLGK